MNSGWPAQRFSVAWRSTVATTAASNPTPVWKQKYRPFTLPRPTRSTDSRLMASTTTWVAATGSLGRPIVRAKTLVDPPGSTARAVSLPARPLTASLRVPSPPRATTTSTPLAAASWAKRVAWPRRLVSTVVTSWSAPRACWIMTVDRALTEDAKELTINNRRTDPPQQRTVSRLAPLPAGREEWSAMNVVVCVKQIPDPASPGALDPSTKTLKREGKLILDESDSYGVEMALQLVGTAGEGEVSLVSMAPNGEVSGLRTALAMGAVKAVLVSDPALQGSDALTTAKILAKAIERIGGADLVLAATESTDGYTGTVPEQIAEVLGWPSVTFAKHVEVAGGALKVQRQTELGFDEVECPLPAVVSVTAGVVEPRYPSFKGIMAAKNKPVDTVTAADLGVSPVGLGRCRPGDRGHHRCGGPEGRRSGRRRRGGLPQGGRVPRRSESHLRRRRRTT